MNKILIIGSSGFFGKSIIKYFQNSKHKKITLYCISRNNFKTQNLNKNIKIIKINKSLLNINKLPKADLIFYFLKSKTLLETKKNFEYFLKLIQQYKKYTKILFSSSGSIYGPISKKKKFNELSKINPKNFEKFNNYKKNYSEQKFYIENEFSRISKIGYKVSIARCYSFYGKNILDYDFVISNIINSIKNNKDIILKNKTKTIRSYMHDYDLANWLVRICKYSSRDCPIFNVGSNVDIDIIKFSKKLAGENNLKVKFKSKVKKKSDYYVPNIKRAQKILKLNNTKNFKTNVELLINKK